ncbi:MAG: hypothetical protein ACLP01_26195 [Solirubrobacteraceae bacterium]
MICRACDIKRGGTIGACHQCGASEALTKGLCAACQLRERVTELAAGADPTAAAVLAPFLRTLAASENPRSTLRWFYTRGFATTRKLLAGEIPITHQGLDDAVHLAPNAVAFLRAALVDSGVLEVRDEASASFAIWQQQAVLQIAPGPNPCARPRQRDLAGRAPARADRAPPRRSEPSIAKVRPVASERSDQARLSAARAATRALRSAPGSR